MNSSSGSVAITPSEFASPSLANEACEPSGRKPRIFVFSNVVGGGDGICCAMAEDGNVLGSHWCSSEGWARYDLGVEPGYRQDRHETYAAHYPGGYEMEFVPSSQVTTHNGLQRAFSANAELALEARSETGPSVGESREDACEASSRLTEQSSVHPHKGASS